MNKTAAHTASAPGIGRLLRDWRTRRRLSQLDLALAAGVSQRHLSFMESGRARPSREMVLRLAGEMEVPLRERNELLAAAGFAPFFPQRSLDDPSLGPAMRAIEQVLKGHEPNPAIAVDRGWNMVRSNRAVAPLLGAVSDRTLLEPPVNVLRLSLHPGALAPHIVNLGAWRGHLLHRLDRQARDAGDAELRRLHEELSRYPGQPGVASAIGHEAAGIAVPLQLRFGDATLSLISTLTIFGSPLDIALSELAIESFFPADEATAALLRSLIST